MNVRYLCCLKLLFQVDSYFAYHATENDLKVVPSGKRDKITTAV